MAYLFADENFPYPAVEQLRVFGHVVITLDEIRKANLALPDAEVLKLAVQHDSALLTLNRWDFIQLHKKSHAHKGIIVCKFEPKFDFQGLAEQIDLAIGDKTDLSGQLIRVGRPQATRS